jgi:hypothetical protein
MVMVDEPQSIEESRRPRGQTATASNTALDGFLFLYVEKVGILTKNGLFPATSYSHFGNLSNFLRLFRE